LAKQHQTQTISVKYRQTATNQGTSFALESTNFIECFKIIVKRKINGFFVFSIKKFATKKKEKRKEKER
jgi:hypothetical protein